MKTKRTHTSVSVRIIISMLTLIAAAAPASLLGDDLWNTANSIADAGSSTIPAIVQITYTEHDSYGSSVLQEEALRTFSEATHGRLTTRFFGSNDLKNLMDTYTDGLIFTPFNSEVEEFEELYPTGTLTEIDGETCQEYYYELTVDENGIFYRYPYADSGETIDVTGSVWISLTSGAPLQVKNSYSVGYLDITQTINFKWTESTASSQEEGTESDEALAAGELMPVSVTTVGSKHYIEGIYGFNEQFDFTIEENIVDVLNASAYSR